MHFAVSPCILPEPAAPHLKTVAECEKKRKATFQAPINLSQSVAIQVNVP